MSARPKGSVRSSGAQKFGGPWTVLKVELVEKYIKFFNAALKDKYELVYIDAFAGSGRFSFDEDDNQINLFGERSSVIAGSAERALRVVPPFKRVAFLERNKKNVAELERLITDVGHPSAKVHPGDANEILQRICDPKYWTGNKRRGVIFLDPFGMSVSWQTLELIVKTKALDLWYLFPLAGTARNLPKDAAKLDGSKRTAVTRILGTDEWFDVFYREESSAQLDIYGRRDVPKIRREASVDQIEYYVGERLRTLFPHVADPKRLVAPGNKSLFSLFFAVSNPNPTAIKLARRVADELLKS